MRPLRLFLTTPSGDAIQAHRSWRSGEAFANEVARTYSSQFFDLCARRNAAFYVLSDTSEDRIASDEAGTIEHRTVDKGLSGYRYHLAALGRSIGVLWRMLRFRPDHAIISDYTAMWIVLAPARLLGVKLYLSLHVRLWPITGRPSGMAKRLLLSLDRLFLRHFCAGVMCVSGEIGQQVRELADVPVKVFRPTYRRDGFGGGESGRSGPFQVAFLGRVELNKGVMDLVEVADRHRDVEFVICGEGGASAMLESEIERRRLTNVSYLGFCDRVRAQQALADADAVIVPTRTDFIEGYNKVVVEAVLAAKPVITSRVCPALHDVREAAIEVEPDEWRGYADAIETLRRDERLYQAKVAAARGAQDQFFTIENGWGAKAEELIFR